MASTNLISKYKTSKKNDSFRTVENPPKYDNKIAQLNSTGNEQYKRITGRLINQEDRGTTSLENKKTTNLNILPKK
jgi:hypothetical protein